MTNIRNRMWLWIMVATLGWAGCGGGGGTLDNGAGYDEPRRSGGSHSSSPKQDKPDEPCHYNGHQLHVGPKGGCYYFYDGKKKEYVDHSFCKGCK